MKSGSVLLHGLLASVLLSTLLVVPAEARRTKVVHRGPHGRTTVVVHKHHPVRRPLPVVVVRAPRVKVRIAPRVFLAPVIWTAAVVVARPGPDALVWEDAEVLHEDEDWTDFTLSADARGKALFVDVRDGRAQFEFAEVVFENGDCQVVDLDKRTLGAGVYRLLDFADGRKVDHVRVIARAKSEDVTVALLLLE